MRGRSQLKLYPNGHVAGFDIPTILNVSDALGYDAHAVLHLIEFAESGLMEAIHKLDSSNNEQQESQE